MVRLALLAGLLAGCAKKSDPGPSCPQVVEHMLVVMKQGMTGHDTVELGNRKLMIDQCEQRKMSATERKCLLEANDLAGLASCRTARPPEPVPTRPAPTGSAVAEPAGSGG